MAMKIPTRELGRTGHRASILALGGVKYNFLDDNAAAALIHRALDLGINYIDTAYSYADSERKIGLVMAERRAGVFLATKTIQRDRAGAAAEIEESFRRLRTDRIDCLQVHDLHSVEDLARITAPDGALKAVEECRATGRIRFVGVTSHVAPDILARAMREYPFDTLLVSLGAMHAAVRPFYETVMPVARERGVAVLAMKVMAYGFLEDHFELALRYAIGLPGVTAAVVGVDNLQQLEANVAIAARYKPLSPSEQEQLLHNARSIYERRENEAWFIHTPKVGSSA